MYRHCFLHLAAVYPSAVLSVFAIPVKCKWLGILMAFISSTIILQAFLPSYGGNFWWELCIRQTRRGGSFHLNFVIFFRGSRNMKPILQKTEKEKKRISAEDPPENHYAGGARHRCAVCGRTELDDPSPSSGIVPDVMGIRALSDHLFPIYM